MKERSGLQTMQMIDHKKTCNYIWTIDFKNSSSVAILPKWSIKACLQCWKLPQSELLLVKFPCITFPNNKLFAPTLACDLLVVCQTSWDPNNFVVSELAMVAHLLQVQKMKKIICRIWGYYLYSNKVTACPFVMI